MNMHTVVRQSVVAALALLPTALGTPVFAQNVNTASHNKANEVHARALAILENRWVVPYERADADPLRTREEVAVRVIAVLSTKATRRRRRRPGPTDRDGLRLGEEDPAPVAEASRI